MKKQLNYLWKGSIIGIGIVAPGASGSVFATILGLYETLIYIGKELFHHPFKLLKELWGLLVGIAIGALFAFYAVLWLIKIAPIPMTTLIVGFVIGSIPKIYNISKNYSKKIWDYLLIILAIALIVGLPFLATQEAVVVMGFKAIIILFGVGFILGAVLVIPGLSGSMILMILGFYFFLYETIADAIKGFLSFDFSLFLEKALFLIPFALGLAIGLVTLSKLMSRLLNKYRYHVYWVILGLLIASPFSIVFTMIKEYKELMEVNFIINIIIGLFTLIIGIVAAYFMDNLEKKFQVDKEATP